MLRTTKATRLWTSRRTRTWRNCCARTAGETRQPLLTQIRPLRTSNNNRARHDGHDDHRTGRKLMEPEVVMNLWVFVQSVGLMHLIHELGVRPYMMTGG